jgi:O-antigen/teichoic acid export membrane protein
MVVGTVGVIVQIFSALASLIVARSVHPATYGEVAYFFSLFGVVVLLGSMGLTTQVVTEVARHAGASDPGSLTGPLQSLTRARIGSAAAIFLASATIGVVGDPLIAYAGAAGTISLLTAYTLGILQGLGRPRSASALYFGQAVVYLVLVVFWARGAATSVIVAFVASYGLTLVGGLIAVSAAIPPGTLPGLADRSWYKTGPAAIGTTLRSSGGPYAMALLLAPYSSLAVLALGSSGQFERAAAFSISITFVTMATTASSMIVGIQYFPRMSALAARSTPDAAAWFRRFLRLFATLSLTAAVMLLLFATEIISLLLPASYQAIAAPLAALAPAVVLLTLGLFFAWTLMARDATSGAVIGAAVQLLGAAAAVGLFSVVPAAPLQWLAVGYSAAAAAGAAVWTLKLRRLEPHYSVDVGRIVAAAGATFAVGLAFHTRVSAFSTSALALGAFLGLAALCVGATGTVVLLPDLARSLLRPLRGQEDPHRPSRENGETETGL